MNQDVFRGVKILDFTWAIAAPWMVKYLADHGAEVVHVESKSHPDIIRVAPPFKDGKPGIDNSVYWANYHCNQYGLSLNMNHPRSHEIMNKLVSWTDIITENFSPGVIRKWGLSYKEVKNLNPNIIMVSQSQFGQTGPLSTIPGTGVQLTAYTGLNYLTGWKDREPSVLYGGFTDCVAARFGAVILVAALLFRRRSGKGMYIDLSQYESGIHALSPIIIDYQVNGRIAMRNGNYHPLGAPHNVYPCRGDDNWCAISVFSDKEWDSLCLAMGNPKWTKETRFSTFSKRKENEEELDRLISDWAATLAPKEIMLILQEAQVPAGIAEKGEDLYNDPQLKHRGYFWEVDHPLIGQHLLESEAFQLSKAPRRLRLPSPSIGEHTEYVCKNILKIPDEDFLELFKEGVFE